MVDFHHFHVIGVAEQGGETGKQIHDDVDADAHVCGAEDETVSGEVVEFGELLFDERRRVVFLERQFGVRMQAAAEFDRFH